MMQYSVKKPFKKVKFAVDAIWHLRAENRKIESVILPKMNHQIIVSVADHSRLITTDWQTVTNGEQSWLIGLQTRPPL